MTDLLILVSLTYNAQLSLEWSQILVVNPADFLFIFGNKSFLWLFYLFLIINMHYESAYKIVAKPWWRDHSFKLLANVTLKQSSKKMSSSTGLIISKYIETYFSNTMKKPSVFILRINLVFKMNIKMSSFQGYQITVRIGNECKLE